MKVLMITESWSTGGIESFIVNTAQHLTAFGCTVSILCVCEQHPFCESLLADLNIKRFAVLKGSPSLVKRAIFGLKYFTEMLRKEHFDVVHICTMNGLGFAYAYQAKRVGVSVRIVHSHNSNFGSKHRLVKGIIHRSLRQLLGTSATHRLACSTAAGTYLFGNEPFDVLENGIDLDKFRFDSTIRDEIRLKFNIPRDAVVIGTVGSISPPKNPFFLVRVLVEMLKLRSDVWFLHVGDGPIRVELEKAIQSNDVQNHYLLVGRTNQPQHYLSAMDVFVLPSFYEGDPVAFLEAQASGCACIACDTLSADTCLTNRAQLLSIEVEPHVWAEVALASAAGKNGRLEAGASLPKSRSSFYVAERVQEVYAHAISTNGQL